jgi:hypothetical protein
MAETSPNSTPNPSVPPIVVGVSAPTYEQQMSQDLGWAMTQGSLFFEGQGKVQETLRRITRRLEDLEIPYAVVGGMALFAHGYFRYTNDVDILVTREGLQRVHEELEGRGYIPPFTGSKHLRDTETHVKIEFLTTGGFPGDGKEKPISFPDPSAVDEVLEGIRYVRLATLLELKLASGMSAAHRIKDLGDVQEVIRALRLPKSFGERLHPYVRGKFEELWFPSAPEGVDEH